MSADWANVRAAFTWSLESDDLDTAASIATNLIWAAAWHNVAEPYGWLETLRGRMSQDQPLWASVLAGCAWATWERGDMRGARELGQQALDAEIDGQPTVDYFAEFATLSGAWFGGERDLAEQLNAQMAARAIANGDHVHEALCLASASIVSQSRRDRTAARATARAALAAAETRANPTMTAWALGRIGTIATWEHDEDASGTLTRGLELATAVGAWMVAMVCGRELASELARKGRFGEAARTLLPFIESARRTHAWTWALQNQAYAGEILAFRVRALRRR